MQARQCVCIHVVLCDIYTLNIEFAYDKRTYIHTCVSEMFLLFFIIISESALKCQLSWAFRCNTKMKYEEQMILRNVETLYLTGSVDVVIAW